MTTPSSHARFLGLAQVAALLQIEPEDVQWLIDTKQLQQHHFSDRTLISDLDLWKLVETYKTVARRKGHDVKEEN